MKEAGITLSLAKLATWAKVHAVFLKPKEKKGSFSFSQESLAKIKILNDLYKKGHSEKFIQELTEKFKPGELLMDQILGPQKPAKGEGMGQQAEFLLNQSLMMMMELREKVIAMEKSVALAARVPDAPPASSSLSPVVIDRVETMVKGIGELLDKQNHQLRTLRHETRVALETLSGTLENQNALFSGFLHEDTTTKDDLRAVLMQSSDQLAELTNNVGQLLQAEQETKEMHHRMVSETRNLLRSLEDMDANERKTWMRGLKRQ